MLVIKNNQVFKFQNTLIEKLTETVDALTSELNHAKQLLAEHNITY